MQLNFLKVTSQITTSAVKKQYSWRLQKNYSRCTTGIYTESFSIQHIILYDIFLFLKKANLGNYADDSTLYAFNKNLETVISTLRQEFSILSN